MKVNIVVFTYYESELLFISNILPFFSLRQFFSGIFLKVLLVCMI